MKIDRFLYMLTFCAALTISFVSCNNDDDPEPEPNPGTETGPAPYYILNGGDQDANNAGIASFSEENKLLDAAFYETMNGGKGLGDTAEAMLVYGTKIYVTVTGSNCISILDLDGKLVKVIVPEEGEPMNPRHMVAHNGKIYVTYYYGHAVAALDTTSLSIVNKTEVGRYPEQLTVSNGKLYIANSGGKDYPNYGTTVSVVDVATFKQVEEIEVLINPMEIVSNSKGDIFVISMGNYEDIPNTLQRIDGNTHEVEVVTTASKMTLVDDILYTVYAQYGAEKQLYYKYNTLQLEEDLEALENGKLEEFLVNVPEFYFPTLFYVDAETGKTYIGDSPWGSTASLYIFNADGTLEKGDIDTGGSSPKGIYFIK